jgi:hypothetical protein
MRFAISGFQRFRARAIVAVGVGTWLKWRSINPGTRDAMRWHHQRRGAGFASGSTPGKMQNSLAGSGVCNSQPDAVATIFFNPHGARPTTSCPGECGLNDLSVVALMINKQSEQRA